MRVVDLLEIIKVNDDENAFDLWSACAQVVDHRFLAGALVENAGKGVARAEQLVAHPRLIIAYAQRRSQNIDRQREKHGDDRLKDIVPGEERRLKGERQCAESGHRQADEGKGEPERQREKHRHDDAEHGEERTGRLRRARRVDGDDAGKQHYFVDDAERRGNIGALLALPRVDERDGGEDDGGGDEGQMPDRRRPAGDEIRRGQQKNGQQQEGERRYLVERAQIVVRDLTGVVAVIAPTGLQITKPDPPQAAHRARPLSPARGARPRQRAGAVWQRSILLYCQNCLRARNTFMFYTNMNKIFARLNIR